MWSNWRDPSLRADPTWCPPKKKKKWKNSQKLTTEEFKFKFLSGMVDINIEYLNIFDYVRSELVYIFVGGI